MSTDATSKNRSALALLVLALLGASGVTVYAFGKFARSARAASMILPTRVNGSEDAAPIVARFAFHDQQGRVVEKRDLLGHVWIADFIYTSCQGACPVLTSRLITVQRRLPDPRLQFVSFSVDPSGDSPAALSSYAQRWNARDSRWRLLSTDESGLATLVSSMKVTLSRTASDITHTNRFFLIDQRGNVVGSFDSSDDDALSRLLTEAGRLLGTAPMATVTGEAGAGLFSSLGCGGCHDDSQLAPPLAGLSGAHVMLERGSVALADAAYIRESIVAPAAKLVSGYPSSMPTYAALLTSSQLDALVGYVSSLRGPRVNELATSQTDPVCGMPVRVTKDTPVAQYQGQPYHFCSLACARLFQRGPAQYLHAK